MAGAKRSGTRGARPSGEEDAGWVQYAWVGILSGITREVWAGLRGGSFWEPAFRHAGTAGDANDEFMHHERDDIRNVVVVNLKNKIKMLREFMDD